METTVYRRKGIRNAIQEFDAFVKVVDDIKEKPKICSGILSIASFTLIIILIVHQLYYHLTQAGIKFQFSVDVEYDELPVLDIDLIVASACNNLAIMPVGVDANKFITKSPSRFEMSSDELALWKKLQDAHRSFKPGGPLKQLNEMTFVKSDVEGGLRAIAERKQKLEILELGRKRQEKHNRVKDDSEEVQSHVFMAILGNHVGVFQIISESTNENDEGTACRIHGKVPIHKVAGRLTISLGRISPIGMMTHLGSNNHGNISHRIEKFHIGQHVWGLVTPLSGTEMVADGAGTEFIYYLKIVRTQIFDRGFFRQPLNTYQYAVTYIKRQAKGKNEHVHDSIIFDYDFSAIVVSIHTASISIVQLLLKICSLIGGVFATTKLLDALFT